MYDILLEYGQYNQWSNEKLITYLKNYTDDLLSKEVISSFPSIKKTIFHIWDAQVIWHHRLNGNSLDHFPGKISNKNLQAAYQGLSESSGGLVSWMENKLKNQDITEHTTTYSTTSGKEFTQLTNKILLHIFNHSTYHRGQIVTMARQLGFRDIPATDFIFYTRAKITK